MATRLGLDAKLYRNTGTYASPTWTEVGNVKDVTLALEKGEADVTTRLNGGWRATVGTLKDASIEFQMVWDTADAGFTAFQTAYFDNTPIELAVMSGPITDPESEGLRATCDVFSFSRNEALEEAITVDVSVKPTYTANAPEWINGAPEPMKTFTDNAGRTWTVAINVTSIKRVKDTLDVNLLEAIEGHLLERLVSDPVLLCDLLFVLCKPEADAQQVSDEEFGRAMAGDAIDRATTALLEELVDFFPSGKRGVLATALAKLRKLEARAIEIATERLESPELAAHLEALLCAPGDSFGNSPDNLVSTPAPSP